ncbi:MAG: PAS domain S-box protein [Chitinophagales bacterium]|nr:PAS domain S-box protein [Chitinophagales bacterium]
MDQIKTQNSRHYHSTEGAEALINQHTQLTYVFFERSADLLAILDFKGNLLQFNPAWEQKLGFSRTEFEKNNFLHFVAREDQKRSKNLLNKIRQGQFRDNFENRLYTIETKQIWVEWNFFVDREKKLILLQGKETTEEKNNEAQLKFQLAFGELISGISNKLLMSNIDKTDESIMESLKMVGDFLKVDRVFFHKVVDDCFTVKRLYGWRSSQDGGSIIGDQFCLQNFPYAYEQLHSTGVFYVPSADMLDERYVEEKKYFSKNNIKSYLSTLVNIQNKFQGFFYIATHQLERKWSQDSVALIQILGQVFSNAVHRKEVIDVLRARTRELEKSNKELEQFAYVASHDLKEPLRMISSYVQLLDKKFETTLDTEAKEFISYAVDGVKRMHNLINDLLEYSKVGKQGNAHIETDINNVLDIVKLNLGKLINENNVSIKNKKLPNVVADPSQMVQLFQNLIDNAIKFRKGKAPKIEIGYKETATHFNFHVRDNGIGIDPAYRNKIFVIFQRLNNRNIYIGNGIGLSICKRIVENHSGSIWFKSKFGKGSTFYFSIKKV